MDDHTYASQEAIQEHLRKEISNCSTFQQQMQTAMNAPTFATDPNHFNEYRFLLEQWREIASNDYANLFELLKHVEARLDGHQWIKDKIDFKGKSLAEAEIIFTFLAQLDNQRDGMIAQRQVLDSCCGKEKDLQQAAAAHGIHNKFREDSGLDQPFSERFQKDLLAYNEMPHIPDELKARLQAKMINLDGEYHALRQAWTNREKDLQASLFFWRFSAKCSQFMTSLSSGSLNLEGVDASQRRASLLPVSVSKSFEDWGNLITESRQLLEQKSRFSHAIQELMNNVRKHLRIPVDL